ncbi:hypothetical protein [Streptomyces sp. NPDC047097]
MSPPRGCDFAAIILALALFAGLWAWTSAPCDLWTFGTAGNAPARCLIK